MAKDPAVLFYTADFLVGAMGLTMAERGQYITLLCLQHQKGHLSDKDIALAVGDVTTDVMLKFETDSDGLHYNAVMEQAIEQRNRFIERQTENGSKGGRPKRNPQETHGITQEKPKRNPNHNPNESTRVENEIDNDNDNTTDIEYVSEEVVREMQEREKEKSLIEKIISYLNSKLGTRYQATAEYINKHIRARLAEGFTVEDFKTVIDKKHNEWSGTEMAKFLRPETLFGTKFMTYLNQPDVPVKPKTAIGANGVEYYVGASDLDDVIPG